MKKIVFLIIVMIIGLSGCKRISPETVAKAESLWNHPDPIPDYIAYIYSGNQRMCTEIWLSYFTGNYDSIRLEELVGNVQYKLDDFPVDTTWIGNSRNTLESCIDIEYLSVGIHLVTAYATDLKGNTVNYSWSFQITDKIAGLSREEMQEYVALPDFPE